MLQGVLGTQKGDEVLWTAPRPENPQIRDVFFGFAQFASYREDDQKMRNILIGLMGATPIKRHIIAEAFGVNRCLVSRYTNAMQTGGVDLLVRDERGRRPKLTPDIEDFVRREFRKLYAKSRKNYVGTLIQKVESKFGVVLSSELIRQITKPLRDEIRNGASEKKKPNPTPLPSKSTPPSSKVPVEVAVYEDTEGQDAELASRLEDGFYSRYAGALFLNAFVGAVTEGVFEEKVNE